MTHDPQLLMKVDFAFCYLVNRARISRKFLRRPLEDLSWHMHQHAVVLDALNIDTMDLWIAYHLLSRREQSRTGRDACGWLAAQLRPVVYAERDCGRSKTGAMVLWALLARIYRRRDQGNMYRMATALIARGRDHFVLGPSGPYQIESLPEPVTGDRMQEIRSETRVYYTGDKERDLRPFSPEERAISEQEWQTIHAQWLQVRGLEGRTQAEESTAEAARAAMSEAAHEDAERGPDPYAERLARREPDDHEPDDALVDMHDELLRDDDHGGHDVLFRRACNGAEPSHRGTA